MIAIDSNLLVYAHREDSPWCEAMRRCLVELAESGRRWTIPWPCVNEFLSVVTHPRIYKPPSTLTEALAELDGLSICLSHGVDEPWSADRDFSRFKGLKIRNPL